MGTGTEEETDTRAVADKGTATGMETETRLRTKSMRAEKRRNIAINRTGNVDTVGHLHSHASSSLQTGGGAFGHQIAPLARPGVCTVKIVVFL